MMERAGLWRRRAAIANARQGHCNGRSARSYGICAVGQGVCPAQRKAGRQAWRHGLNASDADRRRDSRCDDVLAFGMTLASVPYIVSGAIDE